MWEIGVNHQATTFLFSVVLGFAAGFIYDIFKIIRTIKKQKTITVVVIDILYFVIFTVVFFCFFLLRTNGEIRLFVFVGALIGFMIFRLVFSKVMGLLTAPILKICKFFKNILKILAKPLESTRKIVYNRHIKIKKEVK